MQDLHIIAEALGIPADAGVADCVNAIHILRAKAEPAEDIIASILKGETPGVSWDPAKERLTVDLEEPITIGKVEIKQLTMRRAKVGDMRAPADVKDDPIGQMIAMIAKLAGQPFKIIAENLSIGDTTRISQVFPFLQASRSAIQRG